MVDHTIDDFRSNILGKDFARSNLFYCEVNIPTANDLVEGSSIDKTDNNRSKFFIRAAQVPAATIGVIEVPFQGRTYKIPGDRTYEPWTITIMNDTKMGLRRSFERWIDAINNSSKNRSQFKGISYHRSMNVHLLSRYGKGGNSLSAQRVKSYKFHHAYPTNISAIDVDANANDAISEFTVELQYAYWTVDTAAVANGDNVEGATIPDGADA